MTSEYIEQSIRVKQALLADSFLLESIDGLALKMVETFKAGGKVLFCGNGGSAADAQHLSAELSGRFKRDRPPLFAEALHVNTSYLTAVANDYSFAQVYSRMVEAMGRKGDVLVAISTSGNSENIINAVQKAKQQGMFVAGLTGKQGGELRDLVDCLINVPMIR